MDLIISQGATIPCYSFQICYSVFSCYCLLLNVCPIFHCPQLIPATPLPSYRIMSWSIIKSTDEFKIPQTVFKQEQRELNIEVIWGTFETYPKRFKMVDGSQDFTCFLFQTSINVLIKMYQMKCVCDKMGKRKTDMTIVLGIAEQRISLRSLLWSWGQFCSERPLSLELGVWEGRVAEGYEPMFSSSWT